MEKNCLKHNGIKLFALLLEKVNCFCYNCYRQLYAGMAELADAPDLGSGGNSVQVQVLLPAPTMSQRIDNQAAQSSAQECLSTLQIIADQCQSEKELASGNQSNASAADEILKFKQLMDAGVITSEEFESKKKQLLGL